MFFIFFILGLIIGSFLNVVVYRLRVAEKIFFDRSHCPFCKGKISWYDNIPVISFVLLKFKCRRCQKKISWQYPLVELSTGFLFAFIGQNYFLIDNLSSWISTAYFLGVVSFFIVILVYDILYMEIPSLVLWGGIIWSLFFVLLIDWNNQSFGLNVLSSFTYSGILAAGVAFLVFFSLVFFSSEKWMGMGDAYLVIFLGLALGWPKIILGLLLAFSIGAFYGIILIVAKLKTMKSQIPFAPFLIAGSLISLFYYNEIVFWYWGMLGI